MVIINWFNFREIDYGEIVVNWIVFMVKIFVSFVIIFLYIWSFIVLSIFFD